MARKDHLLTVQSDSKLSKKFESRNNVIAFQAQQPTIAQQINGIGATSKTPDEVKDTKFPVLNPIDEIGKNLSAALNIDLSLENSPFHCLELSDVGDTITDLAIDFINLVKNKAERFILDITKDPGNVSTPTITFDPPVENLPAGFPSDDPRYLLEIVARATPTETRFEVVNQIGTAGVTFPLTPDIKVHGNVTGAVTIDLALITAHYHTMTLTGNITFTFSNPPINNREISFILDITQDATGGRVVTWPASVRVDPTVGSGANARTVIIVTTVDNGVNYDALIVTGGEVNAANKTLSNLVDPTALNVPLNMGSNPITFSGTIANSGFIRYANDQIMLSARNALNTGNLEFKTSVGDEFDFTESNNATVTLRLRTQNAIDPDQIFQFDQLSGTGAATIATFPTSFLFSRIGTNTLLLNSSGISVEDLDVLNVKALIGRDAASPTASFRIIFNGAGALDTFIADNSTDEDRIDHYANNINVLTTTFDATLSRGVVGIPSGTKKIFDMGNNPILFDDSTAVADADIANEQGFVYFDTATDPPKLFIKKKDSLGAVSSVDLEAGGSNEFVDNIFRIIDNIDNTRKLAIQTGGIATATTRTWTAQDASGTVALLDGAVTQITINNWDFQGNVILGNTTADKISCFGLFDRDILSDVAGRNVGGAGNEWISIFLSGNLYLGTTTTQRIFADATGMEFHIPTADTFEWKINAITEMEMTNTGAINHKGNLVFNASAYEFGSGARRIQEAGSDVEYNVGTGGVHNFEINNVDILNIGLSTVDFIQGSIDLQDATESFVQFREILNPATPIAARARQFLGVVGGKQELRIKWDDGVVTIIATQP